ncbi:SpoIID/LytB domain-containing protein [Paenibacillus gansuensis]|uniref:SpoIID/LytB domain-containing protein n=1 Tax=Paenibacillus gansuensis TaxID=306542 RepID=A0ABW5PBW1_9BACL
MNEKYREWLKQGNEKQEYLKSKQSTGTAGLRRWVWKLGTAAAAFTILTSGWIPASEAAVPKMSTIRVALLGDYTASYKPTASAVTLSAPGGLQIGIRSPDGILPIYSTQDGKAVRFSLNQYGVQLLETTDFTRALTLYKKISAGEMPAVFSQEKNGTTTYQVVLGPYAKLDDAVKAKARMSGSSALQGMFTPEAAVLTGPLYASAGDYATEQEASAQAAVIRNAGISAYIAVHADAIGNTSFGVWIGRQADTASLEALKTKAAAAVPGLTFADADTTSPYLLQLTDVSFNTSAAPGVVHFSIPSGGTKVWVSSGQPGITLKEKSGRVYRGGFELSQYNFKLAAVNELPMEEYLYAVVSSELGASWPAEALKAQAIAARTYAVRKGTAYKIANISDTTADQAYYGLKMEFPGAVSAVQGTAGEVMTDAKGNLIEPLYYSNSGGVTADPSEVWGTPVSYFTSVESPDEIAQKGLPKWSRVLTEDGKIGYIRSDLLKTGGFKNTAGLSLATVNSDTANLRNLPYVDDVNNPAIAKSARGEEVVIMEETVQSNAYQWVRGPYTPAQIASFMKGKTSASLSGTLSSLEVSRRGPSGRVTEMTANGQVLTVKYPDLYRSLFNSLPSTKFTVEETGNYTILGAGGQAIKKSDASDDLYILDGNSGGSPRELPQSSLLVMDGSGKAGVASPDIRFRFTGYGYGHGLGMSQYGAKALAESGYDYQKILKYYYNGISISKD